MAEKTGRKTNERPVACNLTTSEQSRRQEIAREIFEGCQRIDELVDGYALSYPGSAEWATKLTEFVVFERSCCPFFTFELVFEPDGGPIRLQARGPEGTKEFIRTELAALRSR